MPPAHANPAALQGLLDNSCLWRGKQQQHRLPAVPSGHAELDRRLPGGGWPRGALTELLTAQAGLGEFGLLVPALARLSQGSWLILVDPPWTPYAPALHGHDIDLQHLLLVRTRNAQESLWACEQALCGLRNGAVMAWLQGGRHQAGFSHMRRLQLAARQGQKLAFVFRPATLAGQASPATLRLYLHADGRQGLGLKLLKCRGAHQGEQLSMARPAPSNAIPRTPAGLPAGEPGARQAHAGGHSAGAGLALQP